MRVVTMTINGREVSAEIDERTLLLEFVRDVAALTGAKNGCLEARCGCCTVLVDGRSVKACNALALQFDGASVRTVEDLAEPQPPAPAPVGRSGPAAGPGWAGLAMTMRLNSLQQAFHEHGALQCGFCTAGMLMALTDLLERNPHPSEAEIRRGISGNLCRCTGYQKIVEAAADAAARLSSGQDRGVGWRQG